MRVWCRSGGPVIRSATLPEAPVWPAGGTTGLARVASCGAMTASVTPAGTARTFADDVELLAEVLDDVVRAGEGDRAMELHARSVELALRARDGDEAAADELAGLAAGLGLADVEV